MTVFVVFKHGVYRHECGGVFSTEEAAKAHATELARADTDSYHSYDVFPFELDAPWNSHLCGPGPDGYAAREPKSTFGVMKSDTVSTDAPTGDK